VVRALKLLQKTKDESPTGWQTPAIPRGTLQVTDLDGRFPVTTQVYEGCRCDFDGCIIVLPKSLKKIGNVVSYR
jgi:hypothetical protein